MERDADNPIPNARRRYEVVLWSNRAGGIGARRHRAFTISAHAYSEENLKIFSVEAVLTHLAVDRCPGDPQEACSSVSIAPGGLERAPDLLLLGLDHGKER